MALPASGAISFNDINVELGCSATEQISLNDADVRGLFGVPSGAISMSDGYGCASFPTPTVLGTFETAWGGYYTGTSSGYYLFANESAYRRCWRVPATFSPGTSSFTDGYTNTYNQYNPSHPLFLTTGGLTTGGFTDWYVGALCELCQQFINRSCAPISYACQFNSWWSSTQITSPVGNLAYRKCFDPPGFLGGAGKTNNYWSRALRRVAI